MSTNTKASDWLQELVQGADHLAKRSVGATVQDEAVRLAEEVEALHDRVAQLAEKSHRLLHVIGNGINEFAQEQVSKGNLSDGANDVDALAQLIRSGSGSFRLSEAWLNLGMHANAVTDSVSNIDPEWLEEWKAERGQAA